MIIKLFQLLLAANDSSPQLEREIELTEMKKTCIRLAGERYGLTAREKQVLAKMVDGNSSLLGQRF